LIRIGARHDGVRRDRREPTLRIPRFHADRVGTALFDPSRMDFFE